MGMSDEKPAPPRWRPMTQTDLPAAYALSEILHPDYFERIEVLGEKLRLYPEGCFVLQDAQSRICGYCFSHPWMHGPPPALDTFFGRLPPAPTCYFIHDLALDPSLRGKGLAAALMPALVTAARNASLRHMMLVAVKGTQAFWARMGFRKMADATLQADTHEKYGGGAVAMERETRCPLPPPEKGRSTAGTK
jgi:GNAT superfamily N-acetyltransferase